MRVIDLYAGVGGWAVGFKLAGFEIAQSYEWWLPAANTHRANSNSEVIVADIRMLDLAALPKDIDIVIGSPPCTQFSYSNRGGGGNVVDGLVDIEKFLKVVRYVKPKAWALENVPRVKRILEQELLEGGSLEQYADLFEDAHIEIFNMAEFGVPQRRKRCIAGNFDFELLRSYSLVSARPNLGCVVGALAAGKEPVFSPSSQQEVSDNELEAALSWEEERFNRDMKVAHPVYNGMSFPDSLDQSSRTITATCTRVSRESLVILDGPSGKFRRLSVRERASLQGFPVNFQFLGKSHAEKLKMIGNAVPPVFTYLIGEAIKGTLKENLCLPENIDANAILPGHVGVKTRPDNSGKSYRANRSFRFCIPGLRFKSGTRFELSNVDGPHAWSVGFYFGDSKRIHRRDFSRDCVSRASVNCSKELKKQIGSTFGLLEKKIKLGGLSSLQSTWSHLEEGLHPFNLIDNLGAVVEKELSGVKWGNLNNAEMEKFVHSLIFPMPNSERLAIKKISRLLTDIAIGSIVAAFLNGKLSEVQKAFVEVE